MKLSDWNGRPSKTVAFDVYALIDREFPSTFVLPPGYHVIRIGWQPSNLSDAAYRGCIEALNG